MLAVRQAHDENRCAGCAARQSCQATLQLGTEPDGSVLSPVTWRPDGHEALRVHHFDAPTGAPADAHGRLGLDIDKAVHELYAAGCERPDAWPGPGRQRCATNQAKPGARLEAVLHGYATIAFERQQHGSELGTLVRQGKH